MAAVHLEHTPWAQKEEEEEVNIAAVANLVKNNRRIASRMIAESLNFPKTVVLRILKEDLGKKKLCAAFVPHSLILEQRKDRVTSCDYRIFVTKLLRKMISSVLSMTPK